MGNSGPGAFGKWFQTGNHQVFKNLVEALVSHERHVIKND
jgi:hypothetical protein